jgi:hypothetical protein
LRLFIPANEKATETIDPTMRTLNDPTSRPFANFGFEFFGFLAAPTKMRREAKVKQDGTHLIIIIAGIQTEVLWLVSGRFGPLNDDADQSFFDQFHIVPIGASDGQPDRYAMTLGQQATLHASFTAVRRMGADFFPRPTVLWSLPH